MMTGITLFRALVFTRTIRAGTAVTAGGAFATTMGKTKTDKQNYEQQQWRDISFHVSIIDPQSP